jgi:hypothetical protein
VGQSVWAIADRVAIVKTVDPAAIVMIADREVQATIVKGATVAQVVTVMIAGTVAQVAIVMIVAIAVLVAIVKTVDPAATVMIAVPGVIELAAEQASDKDRASQWKVDLAVGHDQELVVIHVAKVTRVAIEAADQNKKRKNQDPRPHPGLNVRKFHLRNLLCQRMSKSNRSRNATWNWQHQLSSMAFVHRSPRNWEFRRSR